MKIWHDKNLGGARSISPWILTCSIPLCLPGCLRLGHGPVWNGWGEGCSASCQELPSNGWTHWQRPKARDAHDAHDAHFQPTCQLGCVYAFPVRPDKTKMHWFSLHPIPAIQYQLLIEWKSAWWTRGRGVLTPSAMNSQEERCFTQLFHKKTLKRFLSLWIL